MNLDQRISKARLLNNVLVLNHIIAIVMSITQVCVLIFPYEGSSFITFLMLGGLEWYLSRLSDRHDSEIRKIVRY